MMGSESQSQLFSDLHTHVLQDSLTHTLNKLIFSRMRDYRKGLGVVTKTGIQDEVLLTVTVKITNEVRCRDMPLWSQCLSVESTVA